MQKNTDHVRLVLTQLLEAIILQDEHLLTHGRSFALRIAPLVEGAASILKENPNLAQEEPMQALITKAGTSVLTISPLLGVHLLQATAHA